MLFIKMSGIFPLCNLGVISRKRFNILFMSIEYICTCTINTVQNFKKYRDIKNKDFLLVLLKK